VNPRVERLRALLEEPLLVTDAVNVRYLTGFRSSNAALLVEPERVRLFSDFRYAAGARALAGVEFEQTARSLLGDLAGRLTGRIAFEPEALRYAGYTTLTAGGLELVARSGLVEGLRAVKEPEELALVRRSAGVTDRVFERIAEERFTGQSERALAWRMEQLFHEEGAEGPSFPAIVGAGPTGALPHSVPGDRLVEAGETVVIDAGCVVEGYSSDCTRTFAAGSLNGRLAEAYVVCLEAQRAGLAAVRAGASGRDVDAAARRIVDGSEFRGAFGHGLGHGVGLQVHEAPTLREESTDTLEVGNVVTIEPGIYLEGLGGIRIEDLVVVEEGGAEVLSQYTKELVTVS